MYRTISYSRIHESGRGNSPYHLIKLFLVLLLSMTQEASAQSGPKCFSCHNLQKPEDCTTITTCDLDQSCGLMHTNGVWESRCINNLQCSGLAAVGAFTQDCAICCSDDFCNGRCSNTTVAATMAPSTTNRMNCLQCNGVHHPFDCNIVTSCVSDDLCYVRQYVTTSGFTLYDSSCMSKQRCGQAKRTIEYNDDSSITTCTECCNGSMCNMNGCGTTAKPKSERGIKCFSCQEQRDPSSCRSTKTCDLNEVCALYKPDASQNVWKSDCMVQKMCQILGQALTELPMCCSDDFCNKGRSGNMTDADSNVTMMRIPTKVPTKVPTHSVQTNEVHISTASTTRLPPPSTKVFVTTTSVKPTKFTTHKIHTTSKSMTHQHYTITSTKSTTTNHIDGHWSDWGTWSVCSRTCGDGGQRSRTRLCNNPSPQHHGKICSGHFEEHVPCGGSACPIDGHWSVWGTWSGCSRTCGDGGQRSRTRLCNNPSPQHHGKICSGHYEEHVTCGGSACPINGHWSVWGTWSACSKTCGEGGQRSRTRSCSNPPPQHHGKNCLGHYEAHEPCGGSACPINGHWSVWGTWSACSKTCGDGGQRSRTRSCSNPPPQHHGKNCLGLHEVHKPCGGPVCPINQDLCRRHHYHFNVHANLCYKIHHEHETWDHANSICMKEGGTLAVIDTDRKWSAIKDAIKADSRAHHQIFIGLRDVGPNDKHFVWVTGEALAFNAWAHQQPDKGHDDYAYISTDTYTWHDADSHSKKMFICTING